MSLPPQPPRPPARPSERVISHAELYAMVGYAGDLSSRHRGALSLGGAYFPIAFGTASLGARAELRGEWAERSFDNVGTVTLLSLSVFTGLGVEWHTSRTVRLLGDLGARVGYGEITGKDFVPLTRVSSIDGTWFGPSARLGIALQPPSWRSLRVGLVVETTYVLTELLGTISAAPSTTSCPTGCEQLGWNSWNFSFNLAIGWAR